MEEDIDEPPWINLFTKFNPKFNNFDNFINKKITYNTPNFKFKNILSDYHIQKQKFPAGIKYKNIKKINFVTKITNIRKTFDETNKKIKAEYDKYVINYNKIKKKTETNIKEFNDKTKKYNANMLSRKTMLDKKIKNIDKTQASIYKIIKFTKNQHIKVKKWMNICKNLYNFCVDKYKLNKSFFYKSYTKIKKSIFDEFFNGNDKECPYDTLTDVIREFCSNVKSGLSNLKNGNIKYFEMKYKNTKYRQTIFISKKNICKNGLFPNMLGEIKKFFQSNDKTKVVIETDCKLTYDVRLKKYYLFIPQYKTKKIIDDRKEVVSIDPGEKNFITFYSNEDCGNLGKDIRKPILEIEKKIRRYQRIIGNKKNKIGKKLRNKKKLITKICKKYKKIKNKVKELHNKSALYLCKNYRRIIIPDFKTQNMVKNEGNNYRNKLKEINRNKEEIKNFRRKNKLNSRVKFVLNMLSHYKFRQHLQNKSEEYGCEVKVVTEEHTSITCTYCGKISRKLKKRLKKCVHCKKEIDRDMNGSRNILLMNIADYVKA